MAIYIAGPIANDENYMQHFEKAEKELKAQGFEVINPAKNQCFNYRQFIDMGLYELSMCDSIYMLKGWQDSNGALLEKHYAEVVGMEIIYES